MSKLVQSLEDAGLSGRAFTESQLARVVGGEPARRYGLVNRALKDGSLVRIKRGLYVLGGRKIPRLHPFALAQSQEAGSYVSFESALSYHGWIPEAVFTVASVTPGRKSFARDTEQFGSFSFHTIAVEKLQFYAAVERVQFNERAAFVAQPLRALMDLIALRKIHWQGLSWVEQGLRIDDDHLSTLRRQDFAALRHVYKHKAARAFLKALELEVFARRSV